MTILLADIGGTHARLAYLKGNKIGDVTSLNCADFKGPIELLKYFVGNQKLSGITLSVAGPVYSGKVRWTNRPQWGLSELELKRSFKVKKAQIINDMVAQGYGLNPLKIQKALLMNIGTGMGSCLIMNGKIYPCEFGLVLDEESRKKEYFLSGKGVVRIYQKLGGNKKITSAKVLEQMRIQGDKKAIKTYETFYQLWGRTAGNIATGLVLSHVYLWGGLTPKNKKDMKDFLSAFYNKKLPQFNPKIQVKIVKEKSLSLKGLAKIATN